MVDKDSTGFLSIAAVSWDIFFEKLCAWNLNTGQWEIHDPKMEVR